MICGIGDKDFCGSTQARAPERVLSAVWQACGSVKITYTLEGCGTVSWSSGEKVPLLSTDVNAIRQG